MDEDLNRQRMLNFLDVYYAGGIEGALDRCSDDVAFLANAPIDILPHMGQHRGKAALRQMWNTIHDRYSGHALRGADRGRAGRQGGGPAPGVLPQARQCARGAVRRRGVLATLRDGKITEIREVIDTFDLVQQVLERDVAAALTATDRV